MPKALKATPFLDAARRQAVVYARVSSKEQEKEGFSIPAQLKLLKEYAMAQGFAIAQEHVDVETAKQTGVQSEPHSRLRYFCSAYYTESALHPTIGQLEHAACFERDDSLAAKLDKLRALLT